MNEAAAGEVLLLRAFETTGFARWTDDDRAWATRSALQAVGADAPADTFLAARAQTGLRRLEPLDPLLPRWRALRPWHSPWGWLAVVLGLVFGLLVDRIGSSQRINLLAPPVWALIAWNLAVYVALLFGAVACLGRGGGAAPPACCGAGWPRRGAWARARLAAGRRQRGAPGRSSRPTGPPAPGR